MDARNRRSAGKKEYMRRRALAMSYLKGGELDLAARWFQLGERYKMAEFCLNRLQREIDRKQEEDLDDYVL